MPPFPSFSQTYDLGILYTGMNDWDYWGILDSFSPDGKSSFGLWPQYFGANDRPAASLGFTEDTNYAADSDDASFGGSADNGGDWSFVSRQTNIDYAYECSNTSASVDINRFGHNNWRDIIYQGKVKFNDTGCGIIFRAPSSQTYYAVMLEANPDRFELLEVIDGVSTQLAQATFTPTFQLSQWYKFMVEVTGTGQHGNITFFFCNDSTCSFGNMGAPWITYTSGTDIQRGRVGFIVKPNVTATYDDLDVQSNIDNLLFKDSFQRSTINGTGTPVTWSGTGLTRWSLVTDPDDSQNFGTLTAGREDIVLEADEAGDLKGDTDFGAGIIDVRVRTPQKGNPVVCFLENVDTAEPLLGAKILMGRTDDDYSSDYQAQLQLLIFKDGESPEVLTRLFYPFEAETWYHLRVSFHRVCHHGDTYPEGFFVRIYVDDMLHPLISHVVTGDDIDPDSWDVGPVLLRASGLDTNEKIYFDNVIVWTCDHDGSFDFTENFNASGYTDGNFDIITGNWTLTSESSDYFLRGTASFGTGVVVEMGDTIVPHAVVAIKPDDPLINDYEFSGKIRIHGPNPTGEQEFYNKLGIELPLHAMIGFRRSSPAEQYACNFQVESGTLVVQLLRRSLSSKPLMPLRCGHIFLAERVVGSDLTDVWLEFSIEVHTIGPEGFPEIEITITDDQSNEVTLTYVDEPLCLSPAKKRGDNAYGYWHHKVGYLSLEVLNMPFDEEWGITTTVDWDELSLTALDPCNEE